MSSGAEESHHLASGLAGSPAPTRAPRRVESNVLLVSAHVGRLVGRGPLPIQERAATGRIVARASRPLMGYARRTVGCDRAEGAAQLVWRQLGRSVTPVIVLAALPIVGK